MFFQKLIHWHSGARRSSPPPRGVLRNRDINKTGTRGLAAAATPRGVLCNRDINKIGTRGLAAAATPRGALRNRDINNIDPRGLTAAVAPRGSLRRSSKHILQQNQDKGAKFPRRKHTQ